jgi:hypothetical protein
MAERHGPRHVETFIVRSTMAQRRRHPPDNLGGRPLVGKRDEATNAAHKLSFGPGQGSRHPSSGTLRADDECVSVSASCRVGRVWPSTFSEEIKNVGQKA